MDPLNEPPHYWGGRPRTTSLPRDINGLRLLSIGAIILPNCNIQFINGKTTLQSAANQEITISDDEVLTSLMTRLDILKHSAIISRGRPHINFIPVDQTGIRLLALGAVIVPGVTVVALPTQVIIRRPGTFDTVILDDEILFRLIDRLRQFAISGRTIIIGTSNSNM